MSSVPVNLNSVNSVKFGNTTVNKIMCGKNRLWPQFPIILKQNDTYYDVTGIQNNEYQKTEKNINIRCNLGKTVSKFKTDILVEPWQKFEIVVSSAKDLICFSWSLNDSNIDSEIFHNGRTLYWDYLATNSNGTGWNRVQFTLPSSFYDLSNTTNIWIIEAEASESAKRKYLRMKAYGTDTWTYTANKVAYAPNSSKIQKYIIGTPENLNLDNYMNLYYLKIFDKDYKPIGFFHPKLKNDNSFGIFDEITNSFLDYNTLGSFNGSVIRNGDLHEYDVFYPDKYIDISNPPQEYYEASGTITDSDGTYEKLVNNITGYYLKGIKLSV